MSRGFLVILAMAMLYEVVARYMFNTSTLWAFDVSYMVTGAAFMLGMAWTAKEDGNVRVDALSRFMPDRVRRLVNGVVYSFIMTPIFGLIAWYGWGKAARAIASGEVEVVSIWAPKMWPLYSVIALGMSLLAIQLFAVGVREMAAMKSSGEVR